MIQFLMSGPIFLVYLECRFNTVAKYYYNEIKNYDISRVLQNDYALLSYTGRYNIVILY